MMHEKYKRIEAELEGNEYFDGGVSYLVGFDSLVNDIPIEKAVKSRLSELEAIDDSQEIFLEKVSDYANDLEALFLAWHLEMITDAVLEILGDNSVVYKVLSDKFCCSKGSLNSAFRVVENEEERALIEVYIID